MHSDVPPSKSVVDFEQIFSYWDGSEETKEVTDIGLTHCCKNTLA